MLDDLIQGLADSAGDVVTTATDGWRTANRFGCLFVVMAAFGILLLLLAAFGVQQLKPAGWWIGGILTAIGIPGAVLCFLLGHRE